MFQIRIEETIAWLLREMCIDGGFASSLDADSDGEEGLFYTWDRDEISDVLGPDSEAFLAQYSLSAPEHWEGKPVLHRNPARRRYQ